MSNALAARQLLRSQHHGVLSTLSLKLEGYPFGSVVDYVADHEARPVFLISTLAEHTKNIGKDPRVSLAVYDATSTVQSSPRLTLTGLAHQVDEHHFEQQKARYLRYFPESVQYLALDFSFYTIDPLQLRYIGGVGAAHWLSAPTYLPPHNTLAQNETDIITHMNQDHSENLRSYCRHYRGIDPEDVIMLGIDSDGFDVRTDRGIVRFEFNIPVTDAHSAHDILVAMAQESNTAM